MPMSGIRSYLATIGARGGRKSRRTLEPETARTMVRVREARRAFRRFRATCFWSYRPDLVIGPDDVAWVAEQLRRHGTREAWPVAARLDPVRDTTADAEHMRVTAIRQVHPAQRLREALDLSESVRAFALAGLRTKHPGRSDLELVELMLDRALVPNRPDRRM